MWASAKRSKLIEALGEAKLDLEWWEQALSGPLEMPLVLKPVSAAITTDASDTGLGFLIDMRRQGANKADGLPSKEFIQFKGAGAAQDSEAHINQKELAALLRVLECHGEQLRGQRVVWYTDSATARAAIAHQGSQRLSRETWNVAKSVLDRIQAEGIEVVPTHVPGRLNSAADNLSRPGQERSWMEEALVRITEAWGPLQEDPCGVTQDPTSLLEGLSWADKRVLLWPKTRDLGRTLSLLGMVAGPPQEGPPALWTRLAVVVSPTWRGSAWWGDLERLRVSWLQLGRLQSPHLRRWAARNGHWPEHTASLIPLRTPSGPPVQGEPTRGPSMGSSSGRRLTEAC